MEREDVHIMTEKVKELAKQMDIAKTPDEKLILLSKQNLITTHMINLLHKTTMT